VRAPADESSVAYAAEVARMLWPEPWDTPYVARGRHRGGAPHRDAYLFPSGRRPRLLVPADVPGSSTMLQRLGAGRSPLEGPVRILLQHSVRSRAIALTRWPVLRVAASDSGADSIERHLADCFGTQVRVGVQLGTRRANQKPVLQVFDMEGRLLAYAKVGHNELTAALVRREADALAAVGARDPRSFRVPRVLQHRRWSGLEVLVISALTTQRRDRVSPAVRRVAMNEVAHLSGTTQAPLAETGYWGRIRSIVERLAVADHTDQLRVAVEAVESGHGTDLVELGSWHGDWGRWNMGMHGGVLQLWDWERFDAEVPMGFDGLHFAAQCVRPGRGDQRTEQLDFVRSVPGALSELGVPPARHDLTLRLYLVEMATRYVDALTHGDTPALRRRIGWVLSLLTQVLGEPEPTPTGGRR
jgi:hypothetical protein